MAGIKMYLISKGVESVLVPRLQENHFFILIFKTKSTEDWAASFVGNVGWRRVSVQP